MTSKLRFPDFVADKWQVKRLSDIAKVYDGTHQTPTYTKAGVPFYSVEHVTRDNFDNTKYISEEVHKTEQNRVIIESGDILMTRIGDIGTAKYIDWDVCASFYVSLALIKQSNKYSSMYLAKYIESAAFQRELWRRTIHVAFPKKINLGEISNCIVNLPSIPEQKKIAGFLTCIDARIQKQERKLELLQQFKKGATQKIFTQRIRSKQENGNSYPEWEDKKLGELLIKNKARNRDRDVEYVQSVSNRHGFVSQDEYFDGASVASKDTSNYFVIDEGTFAYNPSRINVGSLAYKADKNTSVVSPLYVSFKTKGPLLDRFLLSWFYSELFKKQMRQSFEGSVRNTLSFEALSKMHIHVPGEGEQKKIAEVLTALDVKIITEGARLTATKRWKKALVQRMFA